MGIAIQRHGPLSDGKSEWISGTVESTEPTLTIKVLKVYHYWPKQNEYETFVIDENECVRRDYHVGNKIVVLKEISYSDESKEVKIPEHTHLTVIKIDNKGKRIIAQNDETNVQLGQVTKSNPLTMKVVTSVNSMGSAANEIFTIKDDELHSYHVIRLEMPYVKGEAVKFQGSGDMKWTDSQVTDVYPLKIGEKMVDQTVRVCRQMDSYKKGDKIIVIEEILKPSIQKGKQLTANGVCWFSNYLEVIDEKRNK